MMKEGLGKQLRYNQRANQCLFIRRLLKRKPKKKKKKKRWKDDKCHDIMEWRHCVMSSFLSIEQSPPPPPPTNELRPDEVFVLCVRMIVIASWGYTRCTEIFILLGMKGWRDRTQRGIIDESLSECRCMFCWPPFSEVLLQLPGSTWKDCWVA